MAFSAATTTCYVDPSSTTVSPYPPKERNMNLYRLLQVKSKAATSEIEGQYRKLALKWHPDRNGGSSNVEGQAMFQRLNQAKAILLAPEDRAQYDRYRTEDRENLQRWAKSKSLYCGGTVGDWMEAAETWSEQWDRILEDHAHKVESGELPSTAPPPAIIAPPSLCLSGRSESALSTTSSAPSPRSVPQSPGSSSPPPFQSASSLFPASVMSPHTFPLQSPCIPHIFNMPCGVVSAVTIPSGSSSSSVPASASAPTLGSASLSPTPSSIMFPMTSSVSGGLGNDNSTGNAMFPSPKSRAYAGINRTKAY